MQTRVFCLLTVLVLGSIRMAPGADPFFPLMAWNTTPSDAATFQRMRECGLTVAGFVSPKELPLCQAAGLKAIVSDGRVSGYDWRNVDAAAARKNVAALVAETGQHSAVYGWWGFHILVHFEGRSASCRSRSS